MSSEQQTAQVTSAAEAEESRGAADTKPYRDRGTLARQQERLGWLLVLPPLLVIAVIALYPLFETFRLSLTNERLASAREVRYVGFA